MCGIFAIFGKSVVKISREEALKLSALMRHRGPDWNGIIMGNDFIICHERLAIVGVDSGAQPIVGDDYILSVNGEIYNHQDMRTFTPYDYSTKSDSEVIIPLYKKYGEHCVKYLDGQYSFVIYDKVNKTYFAARDPIGITSLYIGWKDDTVWFSSELKSLHQHCDTFQEFPPGHYYNGEFGRYYNPLWIVEPSLSRTYDFHFNILKEGFENAVVKRMMCDVPYGVLLSGGLDSSLVASICSRHVKKRVETGEKEQAWWSSLHTFSTGLVGSFDLINARKVADFIGSVHHEMTYTPQEGIDAISDVIYKLETYDVTTIRSSTPQYLMARKIKAYGIKMVLSGEGADEIFCGYRYFHKAPNPEELHKESREKVLKLHGYDCLRTHKAMLSWGVEARVPFLDTEFVDYVMSIDPKYKMCVDPDTKEHRIEKWILRKAFDDGTYLPDEILWRKKEQFSDGVSNSEVSWIDCIKKHADSIVTDEMLKESSKRFPINTPKTKEAYFYRQIFAQHYPSDEAAKTVAWEDSIACSTARALEWDESFKNNADPSGWSVAI